MGILAAVIHRQQTGEDQHIDISLTDAVFTMQISTEPSALYSDVEPGAHNSEILQELGYTDKEITDLNKQP